MKGTKGTTDGSTLIGGLNGSGVPTALNIDGSGNLKIAPANSNPNGQATMVNSSPVVLPSDQIPTMTSDGIPNANVLAMGMMLEGSSNLANRVFDVQHLSDGAVKNIPPAAQMANVDGNIQWVFLRTPNVFKTITATASGNTGIWTPTSGKKFRLMRYYIEISSNASLAAGAVLAILLEDASLSIGIGHSIFVPTTAVTTGMGGYTTGWIDLANGVLSSSANNVLNVNLSVALATGVVRVNVAGIEE